MKQGHEEKNKPKITISNLVQVRVISYLNRIQRLTMAGVLSTGLGLSATILEGAGSGMLASYLVQGPRLTLDDMKDTSGLKKQLKDLRERKEKRGWDLFGLNADWRNDIRTKGFTKWLAENEHALKLRIETAEKYSEQVYPIYTEYRKTTERLFFWGFILCFLVVLRKPNILAAGALVRGKQDTSRDAELSSAINKLGQGLRLTQEESALVVTTLNERIGAIEEHIRNTPELQKMMQEILALHSRISALEKSGGKNEIASLREELVHVGERVLALDTTVRGKSNQ